MSFPLVFTRSALTPSLAQKAIAAFRFMNSRAGEIVAEGDGLILLKNLVNARVWHCPRQRPGQKHNFGSHRRPEPQWKTALPKHHGGSWANGAH